MHLASLGPNQMLSFVARYGTRSSPANFEIMIAYIHFRKVKGSPCTIIKMVFVVPLPFYLVVFTYKLVSV
jgi:hypothetical protein